MEIVIRSSDPDEIDVDEIKSLIEGRGYLVNDIRIVDTRTRRISMPDVPDDWPVKVVLPGEPAKDLVTCGRCGRSWDDAIGTSLTPVPSGRCPFEYFHGDEDS